MADDLCGRSIRGSFAQSGGGANHLGSPPHLGHVSLGLSNLTESDKLFISVPPSLGRGRRSLLNAMPQGPSQRCEAVIQPEGHVLGSFLSRLAGAWAAESPGHRGVLSKEASPHQYGGHARDMLHGKHRAVPCHWEICGGHQTDELTAEKAGHESGRFQALRTVLNRLTSTKKSKLRAAVRGLETAVTEVRLSPGTWTTGHIREERIWEIMPSASPRSLL